VGRDHILRKFWSKSDEARLHSFVSIFVDGVVGQMFACFLVEAVFSYVLNDSYIKYAVSQKSGHFAGD
jgi:hypothetical protein